MSTKKLLAIAIVFVTAFLFTNQANAGLLDSLFGSNGKTKSVKETYRFSDVDKSGRPVNLQLDVYADGTLSAVLNCVLEKDPKTGIVRNERYTLRFAGDAKNNKTHTEPVLSKTLYLKAYEPEVQDLKLLITIYPDRHLGSVKFSYRPIGWRDYRSKRMKLALKK